MDWKSATSEQILNEVLGYLDYDRSKMYNVRIKRVEPQYDPTPRWRIRFCLPNYYYQDLVCPKYDTLVEIFLPVRPVFHHYRPKLTIFEENKHPRKYTMEVDDILLGQYE